jgi:hypothetical protein
VLNFGVTFRNKFERENWEFVLKVGATIVAKQIDPFHVYLWVCLHTFNPGFYAKATFDKVRNRGVSGH